MGPVESAIVFILVWWMAFFVVLPIGAVSQEEAGTVVPGSEPGAPVRPMLWRKALAATVLAGLFWGLAALVIESDLWQVNTGEGLAEPRETVD